MNQHTNNGKDVSLNFLHDDAAAASNDRSHGGCNGCCGNCPNKSNPATPGQRNEPANEGSCHDNR